MFNFLKQNKFCLWFLIFACLFSFNVSIAKDLKDSVLVQIGDEIIYGDEFFESINKLHTSSVVGERLSTGLKSFEQPNYNKQFKVLFQNKLFYVESKELGIEHYDEFKKEFDLFILNLSLQNLRKKEIFDKVKISKKRITKYYVKERRKQILEKQKHEKIHKADDVQKNIVSDDIKDENDKSKPDSEKSDKELIAEMIDADWRTIESGFKNIEIEKKEKKFFDKLRKKSKVKVDRDLLAELNNENLVQNISKILVTINKKDYSVKDVVADRTMLLKNINKKDVKAAELESFIMSRLLDERALKFGYSKDKETIKLIADKKEKLSVEYFKRYIIASKIIVEKDEIKKFYDANKSSLYMNPEQIKLMLIVTEEKKHSVIVTKKLKRKSDFGTLAGKYSVHGSSRFGGDLGWINISEIPKEFLSELYKGKGKKYAGPFEFENEFYIYKVIDIKKSNPKPLVEVEKNVRQKIFEEKYFKKYDEYIVLLKNKLDIKYNDKLIKKLGITLDESKN